MGNRHITLREGVTQEEKLTVSISGQYLTYRGIRYVISSGKNGVGYESGSGKTPLGHFTICSRHGENAPENTVFRSRIPCGLCSTVTCGRDDILCRILCLDGLDHKNANTRARFIYIHGTSDIEHLGTPVSHGCIRMHPHDIAELFGHVRIGTLVEIKI